MLNFEDRPIIFFEDPRLLTRPPDFDFEKVTVKMDGGRNNMQFGDANPSPTQLADAMYKKMISVGGLGLSANQLGLPYRVFVMGNEGSRFNVFNPRVIGVSKEEIAMPEGCLSFPDLVLVIKRPKEVAAEYQDETGEKKLIQLSGLGARIFLHEYDHMEGIAFTQRVSKFKLEWELGKIRKRIARERKRQHSR